MSKRSSFLDRVLKADAEAKVPGPAAAQEAVPSGPDTATPTDPIVATPARRHGAGGFVAGVVRNQNRNLVEEAQETQERLDAALHEIEQLRALAQMKRELGDALLELDPKRIAPSPFARRLPIAYTDRPFQNLCDDIKRIGGNLQPIMVRAYTGKQTDHFDLEVIAGHRRRAACDKVGCLVVAIVREASDQDVVRLMASENDNREAESSLELGLHYKLLLDQGIATTERHLAELVVRPRSTINRCLKMAEIAEEIRYAFPDPREIRVEWVAPLLEVWTNDAKAVQARIASIKDQPALSSLAIFKVLIDSNATARIQPQTLRLKDRPILKIVSSPTGKTSLNFPREAPTDLIEEVLKAARNWHRKALSEDDPT